MLLFSNNVIFLLNTYVSTTHFLNYTNYTKEKTIINIAQLLEVDKCRTFDVIYSYFKILFSYNIKKIVALFLKKYIFVSSLFFLH